MKIGVSSYSFNQAIKAGRITQYEAIDQAARMGFASMDFAVLITPGETMAQAAPKLRKRAEDAGIDIANYAVGNDFLLHGLEASVEALKREVDIAAALGARTFRHDATAGYRSPGGKLIPYADALPEIADGYRTVTEYAATLSIPTMVENHGLYCQDSARVEALVRAVGHKNFGVLLDIGNFACADESSIEAVARLAPYAFHVHAKDFHKKPYAPVSPGAGWFPTRAGAFLRGAIIGHGDIPVAQCLKIIKRAGYDGDITIEFEGIEDCLMAIEDGKRNLERFMGDA
jgi:sugar phosphate isomerase/epimerase